MCHVPDVVRPTCVSMNGKRDTAPGACDRGICRLQSIHMKIILPDSQRGSAQVVVLVYRGTQSGPHPLW